MQTPRTRVGAVPVVLKARHGPAVVGQADRLVGGEEAAAVARRHGRGGVLLAAALAQGLGQVLEKGIGSCNERYTVCIRT